jgi:hypothetical protein
MWTAVLATLNQLDGSDYDVWSVNTEAVYHEQYATTADNGRPRAHPLANPFGIDARSVASV